MEANEAPEKIYLQENTTTDCYGEFWPEWFEARAKDSDIEYTRTDSFIEKACDGIEHLLNGYIIRNFNFGDSYEIDTLIEDFKKYLEEQQ